MEDFFSATLDVSQLRLPGDREPPKPDPDPGGELDRALVALADVWKGLPDPGDRRAALHDLVSKVGRRSRLAAEAVRTAFWSLATNDDWLPVDRFLTALTTTAHCELQLSLVREPIYAERWKRLDSLVAGVKRDP